MLSAIFRMDVDFLTRRKTLIPQKNLSHISAFSVLLYFFCLVSPPVVLDSAKPPLAVSLEIEESGFQSLIQWGRIIFNFSFPFHFNLLGDLRIVLVKPSLAGDFFVCLMIYFAALCMVSQKEVHSFVICWIEGWHEKMTLGGHCVPKPHLDPSIFACQISISLVV